jgi:hypothetical protein
MTATRGLGETVFFVRDPAGVDQLALDCSPYLVHNIAIRSATQTNERATDAGWLVEDTNKCASAISPARFDHNVVLAKYLFQCDTLESVRQSLGTVIIPELMASASTTSR